MLGPAHGLDVFPGVDAALNFGVFKSLIIHLVLMHDVCQIVIADCPSPALMGYGPVLAEHAAQVAFGKKDGT